MRGKRFRSLVAGIAMASLGVLAAPVVASAQQPQGEFAPFAQCPVRVITLTDCIATKSSAGKVTVGTRTIRLTKPVILQGGAEGGGEEVTFYPAENGETLVSQSQPMPGSLNNGRGLSWWPESLLGWFEEGLEGGQAEVTATLELATPDAEVSLDTERLLTRQGIALGLPIKIRLDNSVLGSNCRLGSGAEPIELKFTTAEGEPVSGAAGRVSFNKEKTLTTISGGRLVDNTYAIPRASGCGGLLSYFVDPKLDEVLRLPSPPTENTAVLEGKFQDAQVPAVIASSK
jgi:hypothetical protein